MRTLPTALCRVKAETRQRETALISAITHARRECVDSCIAFNEIAASLIAGSSPKEAVRLIQTLPLDEAVRAALGVSHAVPVDDLSTGGLCGRHPQVRGLGDPARRLF